MKQTLTILLFLVLSIDLIAQSEMTKNYYKNGQLESTGRIYKYSIFYEDKRIPKKYKTFGEIQKKDKKWKYWYQNGQLRRIENYKLIKDKNYYDLPDGNWIYYNEQGIKYREEKYANGILINFDKEIFIDSQNVGRISLRDGLTDTILSSSLTSGHNLIINPGFEYFYYKPVPVISDGHTKIEDWIPFWQAPGNYTADYLSNLRSIDVLSYYYLFDFPVPDKFSYAGLALYKKSETYSEYIQGKLIKPLSTGQKYCIKISIALPSYSGFSVNRLAFHFSSEPITVNDSNESYFKPQVILSTSKVDNKRFITLCGYFTAEGREQFITIGRFCSPDNLDVIPRQNIPQTQFGIEKSAYYLIDHIELVEIQDTNECSCEKNFFQIDTIKSTPKPVFIVNENEITKLKQGNSVILRNVNFEFDKYELLPSSDTILKTLNDFLVNNPNIRLLISGHTDDIGSDEYNLELSRNRAKSVYNWLVNQGIDSTRLEFTGFGKSQPLYENPTEKLRALNRRVEVKIFN